MTKRLETDFIAAVDRNSKHLLIVLHGLGDSMEGYRWLAPTLNLPWLNYLLVNAPDEYYGGFSWYDFINDPEPGVKRSRQLLIDCLDTQKASGFPSDKTMLFGFSQGCLMTIDVGLRYKELLGGLIGISGYVHDPAGLLKELSPVARSQRLLLTHGTHDPMIPIAKVRTQISQLKTAELQIDWREFAKEHTIAGEEEVSVIRKFIQTQLQQ